MRLFGWEIARRAGSKGTNLTVLYSLPVTMPAVATKQLLAPASGGWTRIWDTYPGQWQQDTAVDFNSVLTFGAVFACIRLIASDIGKLRIKLMERSASGVWRETDSTAFSPFLRKPNSTQTRIKFVEQWVQSKMIHGAAYVLKSRDNRGVVSSAKVLDPNLVTPLIAETGDVFYRLMTDHMAGLPAEVIVPAREIIHDVHMTPEHPLIGVSPIGACGLAATQGLKIQRNSTKLFANMSMPGGILTAPGAISDATAARLKAAWTENYGGDNYGKTAVLGDGLEYKTTTTTAVDAQLIEQLGWTAEDVCRCFGVPAYKVGVGALPAYNNINALDQAYYSQTLQELIECIEALIDEGLELPSKYKCEFDLEQLLRMDALTQTQVLSERVKGALISPDEGRAKIGYEPTEGGSSPMMQQQNYSLAALARRDASPDPFGKAATAPAPQAEPTDADVEARSRMYAAMAYVEATCSLPSS